MTPKIRALFARIRELFAWRTLAEEQDDEFRFHHEMEVEHNRRLGMDPARAVRAARVAFGGEQRFREETREARGVVAIDHLLRDTKLAMRRIGRARAFAAGAILTLGAGIGAAVGIGIMVYDVLLRRLPYPESDDLVRVSLSTPGLGVSGDLNSEATYTHFASARSFESLGSYFINDGINITDGDEAQRVTAGMVSPSVFTVLRTRALLGRVFVPADGDWTGPTIPVLISESLWDQRYGRDPNIIGRRIELNRGSRRVIGVLPRAFDFPSPGAQVWYPLSPDVENISLSYRFLNVIGRLRRGTIPAAAEAELNALIPRLPSRYPAITREMVAQSGAHVTVSSLKATMVEPVRGQLVLLGCMVIVVLLLAATNVVGLFLLRAERTARELAVAIALGATRAVLVRRFVIEGLVLGALSTTIALPVAAAVLTTKLGFGSNDIPRLHEVAFGGGAIALVIVTALFVGGAIGLTSLARSGTSGIGDALRGARATISVGWRRAQRTLVTVQMAIALALLVAAGLLGRSFENLRRASLGFDPAALTTFEVSLPMTGYASYGESAIFNARVVDRLRALPGVTGAAVAMNLPLLGEGMPDGGLRMQAVAGGGRANDGVSVRTNLASTDYFAILGIPLKRGRTFAPGDLRTPSAILSEALAKSMFGSDDVVGQTVRIVGSRRREFRVIGIAGNVPAARIEHGPAATVYFPILRDGDGVPMDSFPLPYVARGGHYVLRASIAPSAPTIRAIVRDLDRRVPVVGLQPVSALVDAATARVRLTLLLLAVAGAAALFLGVVGVYSVVSYAAAGRLREFGVRLALGATPRMVGLMIVREGAALATVGVIAGLCVAWMGTRFLESLLYQVSPMSGSAFAAAALLLGIVTLAATIVPARRAAHIDATAALRGD
jgi:putative ABC transport system permease protein